MNTMFMYIRIYQWSFSTTRTFLDKYFIINIVTVNKLEIRVSVKQTKKPVLATKSA